MQLNNYQDEQIFMLFKIILSFPSDNGEDFESTTL